MERGAPGPIFVVEWPLETFGYNIMGRLWSSTRLFNPCAERVSFKKAGP